MVMTKAERVAAAKKAARTRKRNAVTNGGKKKKPTIARNGRRKKKSNSSDIRKIAEEKYKNIACVWCGYPIKSVLQVAHVKKAKPKNNNPSNLVWLCPTHHREYDLKLISSLSKLSVKSLNIPSLAFFCNPGGISSLNNSNKSSDIN